MQLLIRHKYFKISPTHRQRRFLCTISQENIPINKYSNILKAQKLKRITEDTMKIMGWEEMCKECQNLGRNPREKHTTWYDKSIKMQRYVYNREREASPNASHLKIWNLRKIWRKIFFSKVSFRTRMYNQLIKQSNSMAKICKDINES
jgi:histone acetyltransferase (RNA polymerase elongator complex component)